MWLMADISRTEAFVGQMSLGLCLVLSLRRGCSSKHDSKYSDVLIQACLGTLLSDSLSWPRDEAWRI